MRTVSYAGHSLSIIKEEAMSKSREMQIARSTLPGNAVLNEM